MDIKQVCISVLTVLAITGVAVVTPTTDAAAERTVAPKALRGTWQMHTKNSSVQKIKITKYTFSVADYKNGKKEVGSWTVGEKKDKKSKNPFNGIPLYVHKDKKGYIFIGKNTFGQRWHLKRVIHKKRQALRDDGGAFKSGVTYYYRIK